MEKYLKFSEYINTDHPISVISLTGKIASIEAIPTNEEVPEIQGYINPETFSNGEYVFNTTNDITPYFKITKDQNLVYKYNDKVDAVVEKTRIISKTTNVSISKTTGNTYIGSVYISEISNIVSSIDELYSTFTTVSSSELDIDSFRFYIDYVNRLFYVFIEARSILTEATIKLKYSEIFMSVDRNNDYFVIPFINGISDSTGYDVEYHYYSCVTGINNAYGDIVFNGVLNSISYRKSSQLTAFKHPYYNSYYDGSMCKFIIFNKYEYLHEFTTIEFKNNRYPSYILCGNNDSKYKNSSSVLNIELDVVYSGSNIVLDEINFNVYDVYLINNNTDSIYAASWDYINKSIIFPSTATIGSYTAVVSVTLPNSISSPLSNDGISNFSLYNTDMLYENIFYVNYDRTTDSYILSQSDNESYENRVGFVTLKNIYDYNIYSSDIRKLNNTINGQDLFSGNFGSSPIKNVLHPMNMAEYIEVNSNISKNYKRGLYDIDVREGDIIQDIISKKPFNKVLEINNTDEMVSDLKVDIETRLEEYLFIINCSFKSSYSNPNIQFYIKVVDDIYKNAFYKALSYDKPYYDTRIKPIFDNINKAYRTFQTNMTILYNPVLLDISKEKLDNDVTKVKEFEVEYGLYNRRYNIVIPVGTKTVTVSTDGYSSEGYAHDKFGI